MLPGPGSTPVGLAFDVRGSRFRAAPHNRRRRRRPRHGVGQLLPKFSAGLATVVRAQLILRTQPPLSLSGAIEPGDSVDT